MGATLSYVCGASDEPLLYKTVGAALEDAAAQWPERIALIVSHQAIRWSYRHLNDAADRLAAGLLCLGLVPGDRIGIWSPNRYEWVLTQFASAKAGLILVNINPAYRLSELEFVLNKVGCKALVLAPAFKSSDYVAMLRQIAPEHQPARPGLVAVRDLDAHHPWPARRLESDGSRGEPAGLGGRGLRVTGREAEEDCEEAAHAGTLGGGCGDGNGDSAAPCALDQWRTQYQLDPICPKSCW